MTAVAEREQKWRTALAAQRGVLHRMANYALPERLAQKMLDLGERKESMTPEERGDLMALVELSEQRTIEKLQAEAALRRLAELLPEDISYVSSAS